MLAWTLAPSRSFLIGCFVADFSCEHLAAIGLCLMIISLQNIICVHADNLSMCSQMCPIMHPNVIPYTCVHPARMSNFPWGNLWRNNQPVTVIKLVKSHKNEALMVTLPHATNRFLCWNYPVVWCTHYLVYRGTTLICYLLSVLFANVCVCVLMS